MLLKLITASIIIRSYVLALEDYRILGFLRRNPTAKMLDLPRKLVIWIYHIGAYKSVSVHVLKAILFFFFFFSLKSL